MPAHSGRMCVLPRRSLCQSVPTTGWWRTAMWWLPRSHRPGAAVYVLRKQMIVREKVVFGQIARELAPHDPAERRGR